MVCNFPYPYNNKIYDVTFYGITPGGKLILWITYQNNLLSDKIICEIERSFLSDYEESIRVSEALTD